MFTACWEVRGPNLNGLAGKLLYELLDLNLREGLAMFDFIVAGALYIVLMFVLFFCISFITIGIVYTFALCVRRCMGWFRSPDLALK